jgi:hypothetical protein
MLVIDLSRRGNDGVEAYARSFEPNKIQLIGHGFVLVTVLTGENRRAIRNKSKSKKVERTDETRAPTQATVLPRTRLSSRGDVAIYIGEATIAAVEIADTKSFGQHRGI